MRMTTELLHELGSCGDYTRVFRRQFPTDQYPDGVEVNEEVCGQQASNFPWSWATETLLNRDGYNAWNDLYNKMQDEYRELCAKRDQEIRAWRERTMVHYPSDASDEERENHNKIHAEHKARIEEAGFDESYDAYTHMQARAFGRIFDQHPEYRSAKLPAAQERAVARAEEQIIGEHDRAVRDVEYTKEQIEQYKREIERLTESLPKLEERVVELGNKVAPARARRAQAQAKLLAERAEEAAKRAQEAQEAAAQAQADADALTAEAESTKTQTDEDGSASTEVAAAATS